MTFSDAICEADFVRYAGALHAPALRWRRALGLVAALLALADLLNDSTQPRWRTASCAVLLAALAAALAVALVAGAWRPRWAAERHEQLSAACEALLVLSTCWWLLTAPAAAAAASAGGPGGSRSGAGAGAHQTWASAPLPGVGAPLAAMLPRGWLMVAGYRLRLATLVPLLVFEGAAFCVLMRGSHAAAAAAAAGPPAAAAAAAGAQWRTYLVLGVLAPAAAGLVLEVQRRWAYVRGARGLSARALGPWPRLIEALALLAAAAAGVARVGARALVKASSRLAFAVAGAVLAAAVLAALLRKGGGGLGSGGSIGSGWSGYASSFEQGTVFFFGLSFLPSIFT